MIIGGTGQYGITLSKILIKKNFKTLITSRSNKKIRLLKKISKIDFIKLSIYDQNKIEFLLRK